jgi:hypothetical protein
MPHHMAQRETDRHRVRLRPRQLAASFIRRHLPRHSNQGLAALLGLAVPWLEHDLRSRVIGQPGISTDGFHSYRVAIRDTFGDSASHGVILV